MITRRLSDGGRVLSLVLIWRERAKHQYYKILSEFAGYRWLEMWARV
jgi:hypothetical protein